MKNVIIGTAGHVDHGKSLLIKALTGIETDRLKEEKKRGITIELGFAHIDLPNGTKAGVIDVPGHEKFIKNMLAGAGGIDVAMLIVAADEGFMPQTREHLGILTLLGIQHGVIVMTKTDLVDPDWIEMVTEDIRNEVKGSFLENAPIIPVSAYKNQGIDTLRNTLAELCDSLAEKANSPAFRIPVDRVFSVDGFGTVITGTLIEGSLKEGDEVMIYPEKKLTRVRNLQVHGKDVPVAYTGQRVAVNLASIKKTEINRGDTLAKPDTMTNTMMLDVKLSILPDYDRVINNASRLHFYHGTRDALCKLVLLEKDALEAGQSGYAQLRLSEEIAVKKGDRFVVRFYSPIETVGGGIIIDPAPVKHKRFHEESIKGLAIKEGGSLEDKAAQAILEASPKLSPTSAIASLLGMEPEEFERVLGELLVDDIIIRINQQTVVHRDYIAKLAEELTKLLSDYHKQNPLQQGIRREELRSKLSFKTDIATADKLISILLEDADRFALVDGRVKLAGFTVTYNEAQKRIHQKLTETYLQAGFSVPSMEELAALFPKDKVAFTQVYEALISDGVLITVAPSISFHADHYRTALSKLAEHLGANPQITLGEMRDLLNTSRKYAIALLEFWDRRGITKKVGDARVLGANFTNE